MSSGYNPLGTMNEGIGNWLTTSAGLNYIPSIGVYPTPVTLPIFKLSATYNYPIVEKIIYNNPATIVYWTDGSKTVVKTMEGDTFDQTYGFAMAFLKKVYGANMKIKRLIKDKSNADK